MINKKILLGKVPQELGQKDAVHVAIVSVRAEQAIRPGQKCILNKDREAVPCDNKSIGIADPFLKKNISRGENFLLILNPDAVDNVQHTWEHPVDFTPPNNPPKMNYFLEEEAKNWGVTYQQLMDACKYCVENDSSAPYPGTKTDEEFDEAIDNSDTYSLWSEWAGETLYEFSNYGTECCPEYNYPDCNLFARTK